MEKPSVGFCVWRCDTAWRGEQHDSDETWVLGSLVQKAFMASSWTKRCPIQSSERSYLNSKQQQEQNKPLVY